ncbi:FtsX-like permease family protein [Dactylosporangium sp. NPDC049525]|uniref:FtsX-like permease family protein n=1 Tax=Dactylosporangium sp. NPDC049525 TaxID=3154730 RepID=UPI0034147D71
MIDGKRWGNRMLLLVLDALRRRVAQGLAVAVLTALLCAVAAAGPQFAAAAVARAAAADVAAAPPAQRILTVHRGIPTGRDPAAALAGFRVSVEQLLPARDGPPILGLTRPLTSITGGFQRVAPVAYRDGVCEHLRITGACPTAAAEALLSRRAADTLGLRAGDRLTLRTQAATEMTLRVTGTYERVDPAGDYWAEPMFGPGQIKAGEESLDPTFVSLATFADDRFEEPTAVYTAPLPTRLIGGAGRAEVTRRLDDAKEAVNRAGFVFVPPSAALLDAVDADRVAVRDGVLVAWLQALALCWLALGIVGRHTALDRRPDIALLKLRGATQRRMFRLTAGQHLVPMLAALPVGLLLGYVGARVAAGAAVSLEVRQAGPAVAVAFLVGLAVLLLGEVSALRTPVATLLRRVPSRRRGWPRRTLDVVVLAVAAAALFQANAVGGTGVGAAAPVLTALAGAVLLARLLAAGSGRVGRGAMRAGRARLALTALRFSRQPGADRIFVLTAVAVALLGLAAQGIAVGRTTRADRAAVEVGAAQVLTVQAANHTALLSAVRQADPGGRTAMAVVVEASGPLPVLAVDAGRLPAVADWRPQYGAAGALDPSGARAEPLPPVQGTTLTLTARNDSAGPVRLLLTLRHGGTGADLSVPIGPVPPGEHQVSAPVHGCGSPPGCRIVGLVLAGPSDVDNRPVSAPPNASLTVRELRQQGPDAVILGSADLGDQRRWRTADTGPAMSVGARQGVLTLRIPKAAADDATVADNRAYVVDVVSAVPVILAGPAPRAWSAGDPVLPLFGGSVVPVRVAATAAVLPVLGGAGAVIDLDAAVHAAADAGTGGVSQVWIAAGTPPEMVAALVADLAGAGVTVVGIDSVARHLDRLDQDGSALTARFQLLVAVCALLLAAVAATVAVTVQQAARAGEWRALRAQGLPARVAVGVETSGQAALVGIGVLAGLLLAGLAGRVTGPPPVFLDDWRLLPPPDTFRPSVLGGVVLLALVVLGPTLLRARRVGKESAR